MARPFKLPNLPDPRLDMLPLDGGLDEITGAWGVKPGYLRRSLNYELALEGGYRDTMGYERVDGQPAPSEAQFARLAATITGTVVVGDEITGATSGATAVVAAFGDGYLVITKITSGPFEAAGEDLEIAASVEAVSSASESVGNAPTAKLRAQHAAAAADIYRADIAKVPGEDGVLGVWYYNGLVYAVRNAVGGASAVVHVSSAGGWVPLDLGSELDFTSGGTFVMEEGQTITGATSGSTAVIERVFITSGAFSTGDAAGRLILSAQSAPFQAENLNVGASTNVATIAGDADALTLLPDGRYETIKSNFGGALGETRVYGCDGVNRGFEFDGDVWVPINTGMAVDQPSHLFEHKGHLFFSFGASSQHSPIGDPTAVWTVVLGASEINVGDDVTGYQTQSGSEGNSALGIFCRDRLHILYGNSSADWSLVRYRAEIGAYPYTIQEMAYSVFLDDHGLRSLQSAQEFGNFKDSTLSRMAQSYIDAHRVSAVASCIVRSKNQYRLWFGDTFALYVTFAKNKVRGLMSMQMAHQFTCVTSQEAAGGVGEVMYAGTDDGYVMQLERGTSFDGADIDAYFTVHPHFMGSVGYDKSFYSATLQLKGSGYAEFSLGYALNYGDAATAQPTDQTRVLEFSVAQWDSFQWDHFVWDGQRAIPERMRVDGTAENIAYTIRKGSNYMSPVEFTAIRSRHIVRKQQR